MPLRFVTTSRLEKRLVRGTAERVDAPAVFDATSGSAGGFGANPRASCRLRIFPRSGDAAARAKVVTMVIATELVVQRIQFRVPAKADRRSRLPPNHRYQHGERDERGSWPVVTERFVMEFGRPTSPLQWTRGVDLPVRVRGRWWTDLERETRLSRPRPVGP
jgi:hypothetical protein